MSKEKRVSIRPMAAPAYTEARARLIRVFQQAPDVTLTSAEVRDQSGLPDSTVRNLLGIFEAAQWLHVEPRTTRPDGTNSRGRLWRLSSAGARSEWSAELQLSVISESCRMLMVEFLRDPGPHTSLDLSTRLKLSRETVDAHVTNLRRRGWLTVSNTEGKTSGKPKRYALTATGRPALEEALRRYTEAKTAPAVVSQDGIKMTPLRVAIFEELLHTPPEGHYALQLAAILNIHRGDTSHVLNIFSAMDG